MARTSSKAIDLPQPSMTISQIWESYVEAKSNQVSNTRRKYYWKNYALCFEGKYPTDISEDLCKEYYRLRRGQGAAQVTVWNELNQLRTALAWGRRKDFHQRDSIDWWIPFQGLPRDRYLSKPEARRLIESASGHTRLLIILLLTTGCRVGAALDLSWDRVDFHRGFVDLRKPSDGTEGRKGRAVVPMNRSLRMALEEARRTTNSHWVISYAGQRITSPYVAFKRACIRAELPWCTPHTLRHTAAVWMVESGVPMSEVSQYLGHSNTAITERVYARYSPSYLQGASSSLEL